jgi:hypothetical protein
MRLACRGVPPEDETVLWACLARLRDPATGARKHAKHPHTPCKPRTSLQPPPSTKEQLPWRILTPLQAAHVPAGRPLTKEQLLPEIGAFIMAGFDTSSHTIAWCL